jgi:type I restriction-modification system DNA methylase subunit
VNNVNNRQTTLSGKIVSGKTDRETHVRERTVIPYLRDYLGYDISLMKREAPIRFGRRDYYADLVFYTVVSNVKKPFLVVETKALGKPLDWLQAESYAQRLNTPYFVVTDGEKWEWYRTGDEGQKSSELLKMEVHPPKVIGQSKLIKFNDINECMQTIRYLQDIIWNEKSSTPEDALRELSKFLIAKIIDEKEIVSYKKTEPDFAIKTTNEEALDIKNRINKLLEKAKSIDPELFAEPKPEVTLKPYSVIKIVEKLQNYTLVQTDNVEILGETYQTLLRETYTEKLKGQRFTPRNVIDFITELIDPKLSEKVYDPACGTSGFLLSALSHVKKEVEVAFQRGDLHNPFEKINSYSQNNLFGTDIEPMVVSLAKANMILHGDGHSNIIHHDGLIDSPKTAKITEVVKDGGFDIIMTNPPFGGLKIDPEIIAGYSLASRATSELTQVVFIERCTKLLKRGGRIGIVLPDGVLANPKLRFVTEYIKEHYVIKAMVSLPKGLLHHMVQTQKLTFSFCEKRSLMEKNKVTY